MKRQAEIDRVYQEQRAKLGKTSVVKKASPGGRLEKLQEPGSQAPEPKGLAPDCIRGGRRWPEIESSLEDPRAPFTVFQGEEARGTYDTRGLAHALPDCHIAGRDVVGSLLDAATGGEKETSVFLRVDRTVPYDELMRIMGLLRAAGYLKIALVENQEPQPPALMVFETAPAPPGLPIPAPNLAPWKSRNRGPHRAAQALS